MVKAVVHVYPVEGYFLQDVPAVEHDCQEPRCLESGAFTTKKPPPSAATREPEGPPTGGSSAEKES